MEPQDGHLFDQLVEKIPTSNVEQSIVERGKDGTQNATIGVPNKEEQAAKAGNDVAA